MNQGPFGDIRDGEVATTLPDTMDAGIYFIGTIRTPWSTRGDCPRRGDAETGPVCRVELDPRWLPALERFAPDHDAIDLLYWMHLARRDLLRQNPKRKGEMFGTFALRSPMRPNPIGVSTVRLVAVESAGLLVRGLDCVDRTPLIDIKPSRCPNWKSPNATRGASGPPPC